MTYRTSSIQSYLWFILIGLILLVIINGAGGAQTFKTQWTVIHYQENSDLQKMNQRIEFTQAEKFLQNYFFTPDPAQNALAPGLAAKIDGLFYRVCSILPACSKKLPSLHIFLLKDCQQISQLHQALSAFQDSPISSPGCFGIFNPQQNAIFLSLDDLGAGILAHEMTHFLLSQYQPIPRHDFQEDWGHYVESHLE